VVLRLAAVAWWVPQPIRLPLMRVNTADNGDDPQAQAHVGTRPESVPGKEYEH
jgi:hypothetical protein